MASFEESLALLSSIKSAESEADLTALVETHSALLFRVAHSLLRSPAEAEDVVQDTFLRVLQRPSALPAIRDTRVWLVRITWNLALDRLRRRKSRPTDSVFIDSLIAPGLPADRSLDERRHMLAALDEIERLPKLERQTLLLSSIDELDTAEIAAITGRSPAAVRGLLFRARTRLRARLEKAGYR
ncbi:RNA polymerase sigma factor [Edaphobacter flagellatus]|uniref:RNA polymerase sigma factor n=1 Tax=Edaphobacter flagellatus TaxID=1933044 RepID=UPI0021B3824E|nr:sigma-70 family RNA polymerase sigma factor [Edaphobacter flagellatus]